MNRKAPPKPNGDIHDTLNLVQPHLLFLLYSPLLSCDYIKEWSCWLVACLSRGT